MALKQILEGLIKENSTEPNDPVTDLTIPCMDELGRKLETGGDEFRTIEDSCVIPPRRVNARAVSERRELNKHDFPSF
ncbi:hypothetical protein [Calycomorphotria hydatis]|uniref:Uncharacterized protein n=1 Tax=Calycomorphotria hydatis TaxID=2528027 RepID=A0A517T3V0_9PLAN|nr:hypothetical protein [Calycomorphotria hydatis]QDT63048.1 hypothetical protein V22_02470 [Calycomorphotria hydatis]